MKINEYNQMMAHLTKPPSRYTKEEKKKIVKDFYKKAAEPKAKPMPIVKYIDKMNRLYGSSTTDEYGNEESATDRIREQAKYKGVPNKAISDSEIQKKLDKLRGPSDWDTLYEGMTPIEKGQWNAEQRKKGMDGKRAIPLEDIKKKKPIEPVKIDFDLDIGRVAKKSLPKDWKPQYLNGNVINMTPLIDDEWWSIFGEDPPKEDDVRVPTKTDIEKILNIKRKEVAGLEAILSPGRKLT